MSTSDFPYVAPNEIVDLGRAPVSTAPALQCARKLHRLAEVRQTQNMSLAYLAKQLETSVAEAREQEQPESDLLLSRLYRWQKLLNVPVCELLLDPEDYPDNPIRRRSQLVKVMKTVRSILERTQETPIKILAQTLSDQLIEIMPELVHIGPWPSVGQSRETKDLGQAAYRRFDANVSRHFDRPD